MPEKRKLGFICILRTISNGLNGTDLRQAEALAPLVVSLACPEVLEGRTLE
jgi:hypothetical protein